MKKVCVLGMGYIGLPTAAMFANRGFEVVGVDINRRLVESLRSGRIHVQEPGLKDLVLRALKNSSLRVSYKPERADIFILAVPTPFTYARHAPSKWPIRADESTTPRADLSFVVSAAESIVRHLRPGNLVVLESTVPPRTTLDVLTPILRRSGLPVTSDGHDGTPDQRDPGALGQTNVHVAHCPERVLPGRILEELSHNDRIIGGIDRASAELARAVYASFVEGRIFLTDATTAEMVKLMENTYRDVNIALANEFALVAEQVGIDAWEATELANHHPRVNCLRPGPGVGGHCIAVDPWFMMEAAPTVTGLIRTARAVNDAQPYHVVDIIRQATADLEDPVIAVLGLAYKADVDDLRQSPAMEIVRLLAEGGHRMRLHDTCALSLPDGTPLQKDLHTVLKGADVLVVLTDHAEYRQLKPSHIGPCQMAHKRVVDTRNCLDHALWEGAGFSVHRLGVCKQQRQRTIKHRFVERGEMAGMPHLIDINAVAPKVAQ